MSDKAREWVRWFVVLVVLVAVCLIVRYKVLYIARADGTCMVPTLQNQELGIGFRFFGEIKRYDIIVFNTPPAAKNETDHPYVKRVVGLPGETIVVENGQVYANGRILDNDFVNTFEGTYGDGVFVIPENCYFVLGDNRDDSWDGRFWQNDSGQTEYVRHEDIVSVLYWRFRFESLKHKSTKCDILSP